jgi:hypothetical protein
LKTTDELDWITPLKQYIGQTYDDPQKFTEVYTIHQSVMSRTLLIAGMWNSTETKTGYSWSGKG